MTDTAAASDKLKPIQVNDKVLSYHASLIYEAKVMKIDEAEDDQPSYFLHYQGWSKKWDEWVSADQVMRDNAENRQKQKQLQEDLKQQKRDAKRKKSATPVKTKKKSTAKKVKISAEDELEEHPSDEKQVAIPMPFTLKRQLVDDWENITKEPFSLVTLPRKPTVNQILENYYEFKKTSKGKSGAELDEKALNNLREILDGIRMYFDRALGVILLYRAERKQYEEIRKEMPDKPLSDIYGAEHLLRLFVRLPFLLAHTSMKPAESSAIQSDLADFLKYMQKNHADWFLSKYKRVQKDDSKKPESKKANGEVVKGDENETAAKDVA